MSRTAINLGRSGRGPRGLDWSRAGVTGALYRPSRRLVLAMATVLLPAAGQGQSAHSTSAALALDRRTKLELRNTGAQWVEYRGRSALKLVPLPGHEHATNEEMVAILAASEFQNGTIEVDVAGARRAGYSTTEDTSGFKGHIGVSFRIDGANAERLYVRPENSRLDNQEFRNRSTQYESDPDYDWRRLRKEAPGVYESYVDLEPGAWTHLKIEVAGAKARLYVNNASEPCLIVNDLKHGESRGKVALWARVSTDAYFANLRVTSAE